MANIRKSTIGWKESIDLPDWGIHSILAKADTGARRSAIDVKRPHVLPEGQPIATNYSIFGKEQNTLISHTHGIVMGMTTMPAVKPGEPICHLAVLTPRQFDSFQRKMKNAKGDAHQQATRHLATNLDVIKPDQ